MKMCLRRWGRSWGKGLYIRFGLIYYDTLWWRCFGVIKFRKLKTFQSSVSWMSKGWFPYLRPLTSSPLRFSSLYQHTGVSMIYLWYRSYRGNIFSSIGHPPPLRELKGGKASFSGPPSTKGYLDLGFFLLWRSPICTRRWSIGYKDKSCVKFAFSSNQDHSPVTTERPSVNTYRRHRTTVATELPSPQNHCHHRTTVTTQPLSSHTTITTQWCKWARTTRFHA